MTQHVRLMAIAIGITATAAGTSSAALNLRWNGTDDGMWDDKTANWWDTVNSRAAVFVDGDTVLFDDTPGVRTAITITNTVSPGAVTINANSNTFTLGGGAINGTNGIMKRGAATVQIDTANGFTGDVNIQGGTLRVGDDGALGSTAGRTIVHAGATMDLNSHNFANEPVTINGGGTVLNQGGGSTRGLGVLALAGDATIGGSGRWDIGRGGATLAGNGFDLTKTGPNDIWVVAVGETELGNIEIRQGLVGIQQTTTMGDPTKTLTIGPGAGVGYWGNNNAARPNVKNVIMYDGYWRNANGNNHFAGTVTINTNALFTVGSTLNLLGPVSGSGSLTKIAGGNLVLGGTNTYIGPTVVSAGRITLLGSASISHSAAIDLAGGTVFDASAVPSLVLNGGQTLTGAGTLMGSVVTTAGSSVIPGAEQRQSLTIQGALTLNGGIIAFDLASDTAEGGPMNDLVSVDGDLSLAGATTVEIAPGGVLSTNAPYTLFTYTGTLSGAATNLVVTAGDSRYTFDISTNIPGKVTAQVTTAAGAIYWVGGATGRETVWDLKTTPNWDIGGSTNTAFFSGDQVTFSNTPNAGLVTLAGDLAPASVTISGTDDYTFGGTGRLTGQTGITKSNRGRLTIANTGTNDLAGPVVISGGTLQIGDGGTAGGLETAGISNNGTLLLKKSTDATFGNALTGTGTLAIEHGSNAVTLTTSSAGYDGTIAVNSGSLFCSVATALGTTNGATTINAGGTLDMRAQNLGLEPVIATGDGVGGAGAIVNTAGGVNLGFRNVTLSGNVSFGGTGRWDIRAAAASDPGLRANGFGITKVGPNQVSVVGGAGAHWDTGIGDIDIREGTFSIEVNATLGIHTNTVAIQSNGTLLVWNTNTNILDKALVMNGGRVYSSAGQNTFAGTAMLNGSGTFDIPADLTMDGGIHGDGQLFKVGGGTLTIAGSNTWSGGAEVLGGTLQITGTNFSPGTTIVRAGLLELGDNTPSGSLTGDIVVSNGWLSVRHSDRYVLTSDITGPSGIYVRSPSGLVVNTSASIDIGGTLEVGRDVMGKVVFEPGATAVVGRINVGNPQGTTGEVVQVGGDVTVTIEARVGHWPDEVSTYLMGSGSLTLTGDPTGAGGNEKPGILYVGIDGTGVFTQTGGTIRAYGLVMDNRGDTPGIDTYNLEGGVLILGPSGIASGGNNANTTYAINLGGGTLSASANWLSSRLMTLTGTNGNALIDNGGHTIILSGALDGFGGLMTQGTGTVVLAGANTYAGATVVSNGTLQVDGILGGTNRLTVAAGSLSGSGLISNAVNVDASASLEPGPGIQTLAIAGNLVLAGTTALEIDKAGATLTSDRVVGIDSLTLGGTLRITASGDAPDTGDTYNLFDAATTDGRFASYDLPAPPPDTYWDTSYLNLNGTITLAAGVPGTMLIVR